MINNLRIVSKKYFIILAQNIKKIKQENLLICIFILGIGIIFGNLIGVFFAIALIIFSFWRPELSLVLIFFSGFLKSIEIIHDLPIDLTVLAVLLLLIHSFIKIIKTKKLTKLRYLDILVVLQGILVLFSVVFISSKTWLNWWDAERFIVFNLSLYFGLFLLSVKQKEPKMPNKHFRVLDENGDDLCDWSKTEKEAIEKAKEYAEDSLDEGETCFIVKTVAKVTKGKTPIRTTKIK